MSRASLVLASEGQDMRKDSSVPLWALSVAQHCGKVHISPCSKEPKALCVPVCGLFVPNLRALIGQR